MLDISHYEITYATVYFIAGEKLDLERSETMPLIGTGTQEPTVKIENETNL